MLFHELNTATTSLQLPIQAHIDAFTLADILYQQARFFISPTRYRPSAAGGYKISQFTTGNALHL